MGWLAWERFRCNTDCFNDPHNCISERLFKQMADLVVSDGYKDVGYTYVNIDDCWLSHQRDRRGRLQPDPLRFPSGISALSKYIHNKGLKFGIYEDYGNFTCAGYPGILGHLETDANTFADWEVDYVKLDGCYSHPTDMDKGYPEFGFYLNQTGRPMVYACSWPVYQTYSGMTPNYTAITGTCNIWRNFDDIQDSWQSVASVIDHYGDDQDTIIPNAGPGHWNDPDMLIIGNFGLSYEQSKTQMAMWAIFAAPLLMSVDLRTIRPEYKAILQNRKIIEVDQDPLGIQGRRIYKQKGIEIWARPVMPVFRGKYSYAIVFLNRRTDGTPSEVSVTLRELGLDHGDGYHITDLYDDYDYGIVTPERRFKVDVNPSGSVVMIRANINKGDAFFNNIIEPGRDAPTRGEGLIRDRGHVGFIDNADGQHPLGGKFDTGPANFKRSTPRPPTTLQHHLYQPYANYGGSTASPSSYYQPPPSSFAPRHLDTAKEHGYPDQRF